MQNGQSLGLNWAYVYDLRSQIRSVAGTVDGVLWGGSYQYRKDGNVDRQTVQGAETVFGYSGDRMTQRGQQDLGWDGNGQLTSDEVRTLAWTWDGQLRSATNAGGEIRCRYDPDGNRIRREVQATGQPTQARKYIVDAEGDVPQVLLEINPAIEDPNVAIVRTFLYADTQLMAFHDGFYGDPLYFALSDQHGSVRQVMDESGTVVSGYAYDPWGSPLAAPAFEAVAQPIRYAGYWWDTEIGRYYCWARYYDPLLERFLSRDPQSGSFMEPYELHRYLYCLNDPINKYDPTGCTTKEEVGVVMSVGSTMGSGSSRYAQLVFDFAKNVVNRAQYYYYQLSYRLETFDRSGEWGRSLADNLRAITGKVSGQAHHLLPQKFVEWFARKGININDPRYGMWVEKKWHSLNSYAWNMEWQRFINGNWNATVQEIEQFTANLCVQFGIPSFLGL